MPNSKTRLAKSLATKIRYNGFFELNQMVVRTPQVTYSWDTYSSRISTGSMLICELCSAPAEAGAKARITFAVRQGPPAPCSGGAAQQGTAQRTPDREALPGRASPPGIRWAKQASARMPPIQRIGAVGQLASLPYQEVAVGLANRQNGPGAVSVASTDSALAHHTYLA